jgi:RND superfamily putative drug exporter
MGARAWWLPRWLDRILPTIALEREEPMEEEEPSKAELVDSEVRR